MFYLDVCLEETLRRHTTRPQGSQFSANDMRGWYAPGDLLDLPGEQVILESSSMEDSIAVIAATAGVLGGGSDEEPRWSCRRQDSLGQEARTPAHLSG